ncbi:hypothetical protein GCM10020358_58130 [Amorphoplanes nipponensis]|uniref:Uncharacterized protein n=1 Tax=Actinoplanes nipponensis TaxID=135950 RepID=A0A919JNN6_9ACTN|nr:hypothetical protein [Actinoplanes nipponensis]GIE52516.1 hypothetical protein Ani05nite_60500 [Actinoplanes nipponensis]
MEHLLTLVQAYAAARGAAERHRALLECLVDDEDGFLASKIAEYELAYTTYHTQLMTAYDELTRTTMRAVPDERLPVCTWQTGTVEVRAVLTDHSRSVRVRYTPAQAIAAGTALVACGALADEQTGGTLTPILPAFPATDLHAESTAAGAPSENRSRS